MPERCCSLAALPFSVRSECDPKIRASLLFMDLDESLEEAVARTLFDLGLCDGDVG